MEYLIDLTFEDKGYNAIVRFVATFTTTNENSATLFEDELIAGFKRRDVLIFNCNCRRIDNDPILRKRTYEYCQFWESRATASIEIEQFILERPDQTKSLVENLIDNFHNGSKSTAKVGTKYNIPVSVEDKESRNPINHELYYFTIEHLIPEQ